MNREIKFRAWDGNVMLEVAELSWREGGLRWYGPGSGDGIAEAYPGYSWKVNSNLMQFTGLLDKNGKEIYEGDIVNIEYDAVNEVGENSVWLEENVVMEWNYEFLCNLEYDLKGVEVIGNIYENPELLETNND